MIEACKELHIKEIHYSMPHDKNIAHDNGIATLHDDVEKQHRDGKQTISHSNATNARVFNDVKIFLFKTRDD